MPRNVLSMTQLREMDLPDQVKALLKNGELKRLDYHDFISE